MADQTLGLGQALCPRRVAGCSREELCGASEAGLMEEDHSNEEGGAAGDGTDCTQCIAEVLRGQCSAASAILGPSQCAPGSTNSAALGLSQNEPGTAAGAILGPSQCAQGSTASAALGLSQNEPGTAAGAI